MTRQTPSPPPPQEWQTVKPKHNSRPRKPPPPPPSATPSRTAGPPRPLQDITSEYHRLRDDPPTQETCHAIRRLLRAHAPTCSPVTKAICLGMGSFDPPDGGWEAKRRAYVQYLVFEAMVLELETLFNAPILRTLQEPLLTQSDTQFLTSQKHTSVVAPPLASTAVTVHTLLYGIHLYRPLYQEALSQHLPAIFVGTGWETWEQLMLPADDLRAIKAMHEGYHKWEFPQQGTVFSGTWLYWRARGPGEVQGGGTEQVAKADI